MNVGRVQGGTNAGGRSPFYAGMPLPWQCDCVVTVQQGPQRGMTVRKTNPGHLAKCPDCGRRRPK